jgi:hypothetical protein
LGIAAIVVEPIEIVDAPLWPDLERQNQLQSAA